MARLLPGKKRFTKFLTVVLTAVVLVTAFTFTASASVYPFNVYPEVTLYLDGGNLQVTVENCADYVAYENGTVEFFLKDPDNDVSWQSMGSSRYNEYDLYLQTTLYGAVISKTYIGYEIDSTSGAELAKFYFFDRYSQKPNHTYLFAAFPNATATGAACRYDSNGTSSPAPSGGVTQTVTATFGMTKYVVNGTQLAAQSLLINNVVYYPAAYMAHALGCTTSWDAATNVTTVAYSGVSVIDPAAKPVFPDGSKKQISVTYGLTKYMLNGTQLGAQSLLYNDVAYYPAAYLANALGFTTSWDAATNVTTVS